MTENRLVKKLGIKPGQKLLIMNAPADYTQVLGALPEDTEVRTSPEGTFDFVQLFVRDKEDVDTYAPPAIQATKPDGLLWFSHPKKSSKVKTDLTRDVGWEAVGDAGFRPVAMVSVDVTWSAFRFRPVSEVKRRKT